MANVGVAETVELECVDTLGSTVDISSGTGLRIEATLEYTSTAVAATSVVFSTTGTDGKFRGVLTFPSRGEYEVVGYVTLGGTERPTEPTRVFAR